LPDRTRIFFLPWRHLKDDVYALPPRTIEDVVAAVTTVEANMLRRVRENAVRRTALCLEMDGGRLEHLLTTRRPWFWSFESFRHLTVTCILKTKRHRTYVVRYFRLLFTRNLTMESLCTNFISLCIINNNNTKHY
jgi:hypothetical protein